MLNLVVGKKGSGKTKKLIECANEAVKNSKGNVVVIEKGNQLMYDLTHAARLVDADEYSIKGYDMLLGFLSGICAGNYDVTDILVDSTLKICGDNIEEFKNFVNSVKKLSEKAEIKICILVTSTDFDVPMDLDVNYVMI